MGAPLPVLWALLAGRFIREMASFRLVKQIEVQSAAFLRGFQKVIDKDWCV
jgi:hypothetical protein